VGDRRDNYVVRTADGHPIHLFLDVFMGLQRQQ
jgi:hypothetical protein